MDQKAKPIPLPATVLLAGIAALAYLSAQARQEALLSYFGAPSSLSEVDFSDALLAGTKLSVLGVILLVLLAMTEDAGMAVVAIAGFYVGLADGLPQPNVGVIIALVVIGVMLIKRLPARSAPSRFFGLLPRILGQFGLDHRALFVFVAFMGGLFISTYTTRQDVARELKVRTEWTTRADVDRREVLVGRFGSHLISAERINGAPRYRIRLLPVAGDTLHVWQIQDIGTLPQSAYEEGH